MQLYFLVAGSDKVIDDVRGRSVAASAAKPFAASQTANNAASVMDAAVPIRWISAKIILRPGYDLRASMWW